MPLHPTEYAKMLGERMEKYGVNVWLVNTGWTGGAYGTGSRIKLRYTRRMITAALNGEFDSVPMQKEKVFGLHVPESCPDVPNDLLHPRVTWVNKDKYDQKAHKLAVKFNKNFEKFEDGASEEMMAAAPNASVNA